MALPFFVEGRSAAGPAAIPLAMLAAIGLVDVVLAAIQRPAEMDAKQSDQIPAVERNILIYLVLYLIFSAYQFGYQLSNAKLYPPDRDAMEWVNRNTSADSRFLVLTGTTSVSCDSVLEWFPALTGRQSIFTVQGREWTEGPNFNNYILSTYPAQKCLASGDVSCLDSAVSRASYDYIYLSRTLRVNSCAPLDLPMTFPYFEESLRSDGGFDVVYETDGVIVLEKK
jgi:hypothetical protein